MAILYFVLDYPAIVVAVTSLTAVALTILTADKAEDKSDYLSNLMMQDGSSMLFMSLGMIIATFLTPYTVIRYNLWHADTLYLYSYLVVIASGFFFVTPIFLWINKYSWHLFTIRSYFVLAFIAEFLLVFSAGDYAWLLLLITTANFILTIGTFVWSEIKSLPEIIFFVLTLMYLIVLNTLTNGII